MRKLGSKTKARQAADAAGMPRVPGSVKGLASIEEAHTVAREIGYPVMLKAAAGGGGKGMRAVDRRRRARRGLSPAPAARPSAPSAPARSTSKN